MASTKKRDKLAAKLEKKRLKAELKLRKRGDAAPPDANEPGPSRAVRFAESVRGILYVLTGVSLLVALLLGQRGAMISLDDVIDSLFVARAGKVVIGLIAAALFIYGLKNLRLMR